MKSSHPQTLRRAVSASILAVLLRAFQAQRALAENLNHVDVKYEDYKETGGRVQISSIAAAFDTSITSSLSMRGGYIYDGISGATPTGKPPPTPDAGVPLTTLHDIRRAEHLELSQRWGLATISPGVSYSKEDDYESWGVSLNLALDFNQKNTTVTLGASHDFDTVLPSAGEFITTDEKKDATDGIIGISQLLGPKTVLCGTFTFGHAEGYLADPYRAFGFTGNPNRDFAEVRPDNKNRQVVYLGLTQFVTPLDASVELSYRYYHDTFAISAHTVNLGWFQKLGSRVMVEPFIRFYTQSEASFYHVSLPGDPSNPFSPPPPQYYSADYRLSDLNTWTGGIRVRVKVCDYFTADVAYKHYAMVGTDGVTSSTAYPKANVVTVGASIWF